MDEVEEMETVVGRLFGKVPTACAYTTYWQGVQDLSDLCGQPAAYEVVSKFVPKDRFLVCVEHAARARISPEILEWMVCIRTWHP